MRLKQPQRKKSMMEGKYVTILVTMEGNTIEGMQKMKITSQVIMGKKLSKSHVCFRE